LKELNNLRGGRPREPGDAAGQISDREDRDWFKSLQGDEKTALIGAMLRGEEPEITAAVLRKGDRQMGLRPGLREQLQAVAGTSEGGGRADALFSHLSAPLRDSLTRISYR
jgi:hypothetical protein